MLFLEGHKTRLLTGSQLTFCVEDKRHVLRIKDDQGEVYTRDSKDFCDVQFLHDTGLVVFLPLLEELLSMSFVPIKGADGITCFLATKQATSASMLAHKDRLTCNMATPDHDMKHERGEPWALIPWNDGKGKKPVWFLKDAKQFDLFVDLLGDFADMSVLKQPTTIKGKSHMAAHFTAR